MQRDPSLMWYDVQHTLLATARGTCVYVCVYDYVYVRLCVCTFECVKSHSNIFSVVSHVADEGWAVNGAGRSINERYGLILL